MFLYPLPFHGAGEWGDWVTAVFSASVLLVGLSIIVWCVAILVVVAGPGLRADRAALNRLGRRDGLRDPLAEALRRARGRCRTRSSRSR